VRPWHVAQHDEEPVCPYCVPRYTQRIAGEDIPSGQSGFSTRPHLRTSRKRMASSARDNRSPRPRRSMPAKRAQTTVWMIVLSPKGRPASNCPCAPICRRRAQAIDILHLSGHSGIVMVEGNGGKRAQSRAALTAPHARGIVCSADMQKYSQDFIRAIPKTDLHVHLDGSLRLPTLIELARERSIELPSFTEEGLNRARVQQIRTKTSMNTSPVFPGRSSCCSGYTKARAHLLRAGHGQLAEAVRTWKSDSHRSFTCRRRSDSKGVVRAVDSGLRRAREAVNGPSS